jgi:hypothetical protein
VVERRRAGPRVNGAPARSWPREGAGEERKREGRKGRGKRKEEKGKRKEKKEKKEKEGKETKNRKKRGKEIGKKFRNLEKLLGK